MTATARPSQALPEWPLPVQGGKYVKALSRHVAAMREAVPHGNRKLFLDDVFVAYLLAFFNPVLRSLRTIEDFSQTRQARRHLSIRKLCRSTLSDFHHLINPRVLEPIIERLRAEVARRDAGRNSRGLSGDLSQVVGQVLACDGSFFAVAADVAWAVQHATNQGKTRASARLDAQLDVGTGLPELVNVSGQGTSEADHAALHVRSGAVHLYDRGIFSFDMIAAHLAAKAWFVNRIRKAGKRCPRVEVVEDRPLTERDRRAGVISDRLVRLAGSKRRPAPNVVLREVIVESPNEEAGTIRLLTNLLDVEAWVIGELYRQRWQIELFFRWLKVYAHFDHLMSETREALLFNFYVAVIGVLMIYLHSECKPSKYAFILLGMVAQGSASLEEILPILKERERQIALARARVARLRAEKRAPF
jgi:Transposase DDE domain